MSKITKKDREIIKNTNNPDEIIRLFNNPRIIDKDILDLIYSRKNDFDEIEFARILEGLYCIDNPELELEHFSSQELFDDYLQRLNHLWISRITNENNVKNIVDFLESKNYNRSKLDSIVVDAAFSRRSDFQDKELYDLLLAISKNCKTKTEILETIIQETNDVHLLEQVIFNKNISEKGVRIFWSKRDEIITHYEVNHNKDETLNRIYEILLVCKVSPKDLLIKALNNFKPSLSKGNPRESLGLVVLNKNLDEDIYQILISKLGDFTLTETLINQLNKCDFSGHILSVIFTNQTRGLKCLDLIRFIENAENLGLTSVEGFIKNILEDDEYKEAYLKIMPFRYQELSAESLEKMVLETKEPDILRFLLHAKNSNLLLTILVYERVHKKPEFESICLELFTCFPCLFFLKIDFIETEYYEKEIFNDEISKNLALSFLIAHLYDISPKAREKFITTCLGQRYLDMINTLVKYDRRNFSDKKQLS